jgi:hypothetical protein
MAKDFKLSTIINFLERCLLLFKTGKILKNCQSFIPFFSFLFSFFFFLYIYIYIFLILILFGHEHYKLSLIKLKYGNNRVIQASGLNESILFFLHKFQKQTTPIDQLDYPRVQIYYPRAIIVVPSSNLITVVPSSNL